MAETDAGADATNLHQYEEKLAMVEPSLDPVERSERVLENTAFFDFSFYQFLFPTETGYLGSLSERALATLDDFQIDAGAELATLMLDLLLRVEHGVRDQVRRSQRRDWDEEQVVQDLLDDFYRVRADTLPDMVGAYQDEIDDGIGGLFLEFLSELTAAYLRRRLYQAYPNFYGFWSAWPGHFRAEYPAWHRAVQPPAPPPPPPPPPPETETPPPEPPPHLDIDERDPDGPGPKLVK